jgi:hypothetical protein
VEKDESKFVPGENRCRSCRSAYAHAYYLENKAQISEYHHNRYIDMADEYRARARAWDKNNPERAKANHAAKYARKQAAMDALKRPCAICGESFVTAIDFHHLDPSNKAFNIGENKGRFRIEALAAEVAKCICLCANCHRKYHAGYEPVMSLVDALRK